MKKGQKGYREISLKNLKRRKRIQRSIPYDFRKDKRDTGEQVGVSRKCCRKQEEIPESKLAYPQEVQKAKERYGKASLRKQEEIPESKLVHPGSCIKS